MSSRVLRVVYGEMLYGLSFAFFKCCLRVMSVNMLVWCVYEV